LKNEKPVKARKSKTIREDNVVVSFELMNYVEIIRKNKSKYTLGP
jgi:hypothetical protein